MFVAAYGNVGVDDVPPAVDRTRLRIFMVAGAGAGVGVGDGAGVAVGDGTGVGVGVGVGCTTPKREFTRRLGVVGSTFVTTPNVEVPMIAWATTAGVAFGCELRYNAAMPATAGEDIEVPLK